MTIHFYYLVPITQLLSNDARKEAVSLLRRCLTGTITSRASFTIAHFIAHDYLFVDVVSGSTLKQTWRPILQTKLARFMNQFSNNKYNWAERCRKSGKDIFNSTDLLALS